MTVYEYRGLALGGPRNGDVLTSPYTECVVPCEGRDFRYIFGGSIPGYGVWVPVSKCNTLPPAHAAIDILIAEYRKHNASKISPDNRRLT